MAENWAVVIGINNYRFLSNLNYACEDATAIKDIFEKKGFDKIFFFSNDSPPIKFPSGHTMGSDPSFGNLFNFFENAFINPALKPEDNLWFFFAGHGQRYSDIDYLMPQDGNISKPDVTGLGVNFICQRLRRCGSGNVILFIDACRNTGKRSGLGIGQTLQQGVVTITSCQPSESSWEVDELKHGIFTFALLEAFTKSGNINCATVEKLDKYLQNRVPELCKEYRKDPIQTPITNIEPIDKRFFVLFPEYSTIADIERIKNKATSLVAHHENLDFADELCTRGMEALQGRDSNLFRELRKLSVKIESLRSKNTEDARPRLVKEPNVVNDVLKNPSEVSRKTNQQSTPVTNPYRTQYRNHRIEEISKKSETFNPKSQKFERDNYPKTSRNSNYQAQSFYTVPTSESPLNRQNQVDSIAFHNKIPWKSIAQWILVVLGIFLLVILSASDGGAFLIPLIVTWIITTIALVIITFLPTGVESDSFGKTAVTALVFGVLNGVVGVIAGLPVLGGVLWLVTLGGLLLNLILFFLSAKLVEGFRLRWGIWSAIIGAFLLSMITSILNAII